MAGAFAGFYAMAAAWWGRRGLFLGQWEAAFLCVSGCGRILGGNNSDEAGFAAVISLEVFVTYPRAICHQLCLAGNPNALQTGTFPKCAVCEFLHAFRQDDFLQGCAK